MYEYPSHEVSFIIERILKNFNIANEYSPKF